MTPTVKIILGDCLTELAKLPAESVHCCVTSPPYWGLRDYGVAGQIGLERTPEDYVALMVGVFREVRRVLRDDGTLWLNLGDSYASNAATNKGHPGGFESYRGSDTPTLNTDQQGRIAFRSEEIKGKDLVGIPWSVAFALRKDGWYLRSDIIWHKPNPMPESVTDRPTKSHEYLFLLAKNDRYFYDAEAIKEQVTGNAHDRGDGMNPKRLQGVPGMMRSNPTFTANELVSSRNKRTVWTVATYSYPDSHFATFPPDLIKPCILAGTSAKGCCPKCGAPWERVIEPNGRIRSGGTTERTKGLSIGHGNGGNSMLLDGAITQYKTIGWQPGCDCLARNSFTHPADPLLPPIPCTVLDPFAGSGTTGQVALELGRNAILIELNPAYVKLANDRTFTTPGLALA